VNRRAPFLASIAAVFAPFAGAQESEVKPNRLAKETSPYLRQHATNPVDWYPWGEEALALAKKLDRPIFLSIGYSACHWCHVMAHESFANAETAALLNANFVCIKVDREERPDVDEIYMAAVQAMGEQGGWPLSVWLLPDGKPFYGGTYFPPEDGFGRPGFKKVLEHLGKAWRDKRSEIDKGAGELTAHLRQVLAPAMPAGEPDAKLLDAFVARSKQRFDSVHGGFAEPPRFAPKFPSARELQVLLRRSEPEALAMAETTLRGMRRGGIFDQLGGGFHRYSTDRAWVVPHFEKMLYDNALLVPCYLDAYVRTGDEDFAVVARQTLDWMLSKRWREPFRTVIPPPKAGGLMSSTDAQSEGIEGKYFVWSEADFDAAAGPDAEWARDVFGVTDAGNHEGQNVLVLAKPVGADDAARFARVRNALLDARSKRVAPSTDTKVLCAWNALAIQALANGYRVLGDDRYRVAGREVADFVLQKMTKGGRCLRQWHAEVAPTGRPEPIGDAPSAVEAAKGPGFLEDHTMLAEALLALFEVDSDPRWLAAARDLLDVVQKHFGAEDGSFWFTADDHEQLVARAKSPFESALPSGIAAAANAMLRAGLLLGDEPLYQRGVAVLRANREALAKAPTAVPSLVLALQFHLGDPREVVIAGQPDDPRTTALREAAWRTFPAPQVVALVHEGNRQALEKLSPVFAGKTPIDGVPAAYVCRRGVCEKPITDPAALRNRK